MAGWNVEELRAVVLQFYKATTDSNATTEPPSVRDDVIGQWAAFEAWRASRPAEVAVFELESIPVVRYLIKSVTGPEVSHYIDIDPAMGTCQPEDFIFKKLEQFEKMSQAIWLNPFNYSEGTIGSVDGLGHDLAPYCEISNRMLNTALDGGMLSGGLVLQAQQGWDAASCPWSHRASDADSAGAAGHQLRVRAAHRAVARPAHGGRGVYSNNVGMTRMNPSRWKSARGAQLDRGSHFRAPAGVHIEANAANFSDGLACTRDFPPRRDMPEVEKLRGQRGQAFRGALRRNVPGSLRQVRDAWSLRSTVGGGSPGPRTTWAARGTARIDGRGWPQVRRAPVRVGPHRLQERRRRLPAGHRDQMRQTRSPSLPSNNDTAGHTCRQRSATHRPSGDPLRAAGRHGASYDQPRSKPRRQRPSCGRSLRRAVARASVLARRSRRTLSGACDMLKELVVFYRREEGKPAERRPAPAPQMERQQRVMQELENRMNGETAVKLREVELKAQLEP